MIRIGRVEIPNPVVVAPMSGITDRPFRRVAAEMGAGLLCTEMASAIALVRQGPQTCELTRVWPDEHPVSVQLMGREPEPMAEAARMVVAEGADIVDINMGCPVDKVAKKVCAGAGLARDIPVATAVASAMIAAIDPVPLTVKMRLGWDDSTKNCVDLARALEDVGVAAVAVHGRTRVQGYSGEADWEHIGAVKAAVGIPVFGSGDIRTAADARRRMDETGCDGVLLARGMMGNPWLIRQCVALLGSGRGGAGPDLGGARRPGAAAGRLRGRPLRRAQGGAARPQVRLLGGARDARRGADARQRPVPGHAWGPRELLGWPG